MRLLTPCLLSLMSSVAWSAELAPRPDISMLPVTTSGIANSLIRTFDPDDWGSRQNKTYVQNYTSSQAVSSDGIIYTATTWEEGHRAAGTYRNGDCLPDHPDFGTGWGDTVAVGEKLVAYGTWDKVILIDRTPGNALDGQGGQKRREIVITTEKSAPKFSAIALDEGKGQVWVATSGDGAVRGFNFNGSPVTMQPITVPRVEGLAVDHLGTLWVMQHAQRLGQEPIAGTVFAAPAAAGHEADQATASDDKTWYQAASADSWCGIELATPTTLAGLRFTGAGEARFVGGAIEVSAVGKDGPWTEVASINQNPSGWPDTYVTLPAASPLKAVRVRGPLVALRNLTVYAQLPALPGSVQAFSADGKPLARTLVVANPTGISADAARKRLLVCEGAPDHQVLGYTGLDGKPALDPSFGSKGRFGIQGGVYAGTGATIGSVGPQRFDYLRGAGADKAGNVYVNMVGSMGLNQTRFESYDPKGERRWSIAGLSFIDGADCDPIDDTNLRSASSRYRMDFSKPAGNEWTHVATTVDAARFPGDPRLHFAGQTFGMRRIHGQPFLITTVAVNEFAFFRFNEKLGDIGIPCASFTPWHTSKPYPANQPVGYNSVIWQDRNGDGASTADEFTKDPNEGIRSLSWIDDDGNHWSLDQRSQRIQRLSVAAKLDQHGSPHWDYASADNRAYPIPAPFTDLIKTIRVGSGDGAVYLCGFTTDLPSTLGGNVPTGRLLVRYAQKDGALVEQARVVLPYDVHFGTEWIKETRDQAAAMSLAGDYVFVAYQRTMNTLVYRAKDLTLVGRIDVGFQVHTPLIDGPAEMIARKRTGANEYLLFYPMYVGNATTMVRWSPDAKTYLPAPAKLKAQDGALTWDAVPAAKGYRLERMDLTPAGWSPWQAAGDYPDAGCKDSKAPVDAAGHSWRVRALGPTPSDWSFSVFTRK